MCRLILSVEITDRRIPICAGAGRSSGGSNLRISVPVFPVTVVLQMPVYSAQINALLTHARRMRTSPLYRIRPIIIGIRPARIGRRRAIAIPPSRRRLLPTVTSECDNGLTPMAQISEFDDRIIKFSHGNFPSTRRPHQR